MDKFRTISTASSLVNINALLYKLVERLPIVYHRVKMQRLKYNWQSFNLSLISHFDIFSLITFLLQSTPLHFASHYRKYLSTMILVRFAIVSKKKKNYIDTVCDYLESGKLLISLWNQFLRELHLEGKNFRNYSISDNIDQSCKCVDRILKIIIRYKD